MRLSLSSFFISQSVFLSFVLLSFRLKNIRCEYLVKRNRYIIAIDPSNISVFSSFCLFIFLSFPIFIFLSFRLFVYLSFCHLRSSFVIGGPIKIINHERPSSMLGMVLRDWIGMGWLSWVVGILIAPMVLMKAN